MSENRSRGLLASLLIAGVVALLASLGGGWGDALGQTAGPPPTRPPSGAAASPGDGVVPLPAPDYRPLQPRQVVPPQQQAPIVVPQAPASQPTATALPTATPVPATATANPMVAASPTARPSHTPMPSPSIAATVTAPPASAAAQPPASGPASIADMGWLSRPALAGAAAVAAALVGVLWARRRRV